MANSTTHIDTIAQSQAGKEITANAFFDAASPATLYGRRASTCAALTWGYYGGAPTLSGGSLGSIANGTLSLTPSTTNYIVSAKATGAVTTSTSNTNWNDTTNYWRLYSVVTGTSSITSYTDSRELGKMTGGGGTGSAITAKDEGTNLTTSMSSINFAGSGVTATTSGNDVTVTIPGGASVTVKDEGTNLTTSVTSIDFTGGGVTATNTGDAVTVSIGGSASITAKDEGTNLTTSMASINFVGGGVTATNSSGDVTVTIPGGAGREILTADRTYYVRTDGSDSNNGLADTSGGAFLTPQKAIDVFWKTIDCAGYAANVHLGDGTYTGTIAMRQLVGATTLTIQGNSGTPDNVLISTTSSTAVTNQVPGTTLHVKDLKITTTTAGNCMSTVGGFITFANINFGAAANYHRYATAGGRISASGNYTISGGAQAHLAANSGGINQTVSRTVTLTGTPNFSVAYAWMGTPAYIEDYSNTFSGSATGKRYSNSACSVINTNGGGANYFPGSTAGDTPTTGAQYI